MRAPARRLLLALAFSALATPCLADATAFLSANTAPDTRVGYGFAAGASLLVVGWEVEYARAIEDTQNVAPLLRTLMGNVFAQNPVPLNGLTFYATLGGGFYQEKFGDTSETNLGTNLGGGVKIDLSGPLRLRLDYRLFTFAGSATHKTPQRFYAGLTLRF